MKTFPLATNWLPGIICGCSLLMLQGCGGETPGAGDASLPTASVNPADTIPDMPPKTEAANDPSTAEWAIHEILRRRLQPAPGGKADKDGKIQQVSVSEINAYHRQRNQEIVKLAEQAIAKTHDDPAQEATFSTAVHHLMEAQLQLAIQVSDLEDPAHKEAVNTLYKNAELLFRERPNSKAAAEAGFTLVKFAEIMARRFAANDERWLEEYARQAQLFARNFPKEEARAVAKLDAAGWSCESHQLNELARVCYQEIANRFPKNPAAADVTAVLRRLSLPGQSVRLAGPTIDGGFTDIADKTGKVVIVQFWAAEVAGVEEHTAILQGLMQKFGPSGLTVLGVNLDADEDVARQFIADHKVAWDTIFHADPAKRRWNNPIVNYYGVRNIPTYWVIHRDGTVISTHVDVTELDAPLGKLLSGNGS